MKAFFKLAALAALALMMSGFAAAQAAPDEYAQGAWFKVTLDGDPLQAAAAATSRKARCPEVGHGTVHRLDVEGGCWQFRRDDGANFELVTKRRFKDGAAGTLFGSSLNVLTLCQVGQPTEVCRWKYDAADEPLLVQGILVRGVENNCYLIATEEEDYLVTNCGDFEDLCLDENLGWEVVAQVNELGGVFTTCMQGVTVEVLAFEFTGEAVTEIGGNIDSSVYGSNPSWILPLAPAGYGGQDVINPY